MLVLVSVQVVKLARLNTAVLHVTMFPFNLNQNLTNGAAAVAQHQLMQCNFFW